MCHKKRPCQRLRNAKNLMLVVKITAILPIVVKVRMGEDFFR
jgi:hypothetical protein